jgi:stage V sporulation protein G
MKVSECRIRISDKSPVCGIASITLDDQFVVKGIRILNIRDRLLVCMPSRPGPDGVHRDLAHPINPRTRDMINQCILKAYEDELGAETQKCETRGTAP